MGDVSALSIEIVNLDASMAEDLVRIEHLAFPMANRDELFSVEIIEAYARVFPEGYFVAKLGSELVGQGAGIYLDFDFDHPQHTIVEITGENQCGNHDPDGDWYYGTDISVHPDYRGLGVGKRLYEARKDLVRRHGKRGIIAGASLPGFFEHKDGMTIHEYVDRVVAGDLTDPTLSFQMGNGFQVRGLLENYMDDPADDGWAALIVWEVEK